MTVLQRLSELGFNEATGQLIRGKYVVKVRTSKGWTYEKFSSESASAEVDSWAAGREP